MNTKTSCCLLRNGISKYKAAMLPLCSYYATKSSDTKQSAELTEIEQKFERIKLKNKRKEELLVAIDQYRESRGKHGGYVDFIENVSENLKNVDLHKDLDIYKALLMVFPEGKLVPKNIWQRIMMYYPVQQCCAVKLLDQMNWFEVQPDKEVYDIMVSRFGKYNWATNKIKRMLYWMPKLKNTNKYMDRRKVEHQNLNDVEIARLALKMICRDAGTQIKFLKSPSNGSWILSAQSPLQKKIVSGLSTGTSCYVDGPSRVYVMDKPVMYMVLSSSHIHSHDEKWIDQRSIYDLSDIHSKLADENKETTLHHQSDMTILSLAVLEQNTQKNAASWINDLVASSNPRLGQSSILFRIKEPFELYPC